MGQLGSWWCSLQAFETDHSALKAGMLASWQGGCHPGLSFDPTRTWQEPSSWPELAVGLPHWGTALVPLRAQPTRLCWHRPCPWASSQACLGRFPHLQTCTVCQGGHREFTGQVPKDGWTANTGWACAKGHRKIPFTQISPHFKSLDVPFPPQGARLLPHTWVDAAEI